MAAKVSMTVSAAAVCTREVRKGSDTVKRSMSHCTSGMTDAAAPQVPCLDRRSDTQWDDGGLYSDCGPEKLVQFINKMTFSSLHTKP